MQRIPTPRRTRRAALALGGLLVAAGAAGVATGSVAADFKQAPCTGKTIYVTQDNTTVHGTCGDDHIFVSEHTEVTIFAGDGNDKIHAGWGTGRVTIHAGNGNDEIGVSAYDKQLIVFAGEGDDVVRAAWGDDYIYGQGGNDLIFGNLGKNTIDGGEGDDTIFSVSGEQGAPDHLAGGPGYDVATIDPGDTTVGIEAVTVKQ